MQTIFTGHTYVFGNNIDTDQIYPGRFLEQIDPQEIAKHCMEGARPGFAAAFRAGGIVVGGTNFGCGSSREHAVITLKSLGVPAVLAKSYARIFYRNGINLGLALVVCPELDELHITEGDEITIDIETGIVTNRATDRQVACEPISAYALNILAHGGIKNLIKKEMRDADSI